MSTKKIGIYFPDYKEGVYLPILQGVQSYCARHPEFELAYSTEGRYLLEINDFQRAQLDGIIVSLQRSRKDDIEEVSRLGIPIVNTLGGHFFDGGGHVLENEIALTGMIHEHLVSRGFRKIYLVGNQNMRCIRRRFSSLQQSCRETSCYAELQHFVYQKNRWDQLNQELERWIATLEPPFAVFASFSLIGKMLVNVCKKRGLNIPKDVAILAHENDLPSVVLSVPTLSSIVPNYTKIGYAAANDIAKRIEHPEEFSGKTTEVFIDPIRVEERQSTNVSVFQDVMVNRIVEYIRLHVSDVTVNELLEKFPMARSVLDEKFLKYIGHSPYREILKQKLKLACDIVSETDYTLEHIAQEAGFSHASHLIRLFKREYGQTPQQYRRRVAIRG